MLSGNVCVSWKKKKDTGKCGEGVRNVNPPTRRGSQFDQSAQERMIIKNPTARTKESKMTALRYVRI